MGFLDLIFSNSTLNKVENKRKTDEEISNIYNNNLSFSDGVTGYQYHQDNLKYLYVEAGNKDNQYVTTNIVLKHEKTNKYDKNAIGIYYKNKLIGYISKYKNKEVLKYKSIYNVVLRTYFYKDNYRAEIYFNYK